MKTLFALLLLSALLGLASCKKNLVENYSCNDGSCCNPNEKVRYEYDHSFAGEPVAILEKGGVIGLYFKEWMGVNGYSAKTPVAQICQICADKVVGLDTAYVAILMIPPSFKYRAWGKVYKPPYWNGSFGGLPILYVTVDRIEEIK